MLYIIINLYLVVSLHRGRLLCAVYHNDLYLVVSFTEVGFSVLYNITMTCTWWYRCTEVCFSVLYIISNLYLVVSFHRGRLLRAVYHNDVYLVVSLHRGVLLRAVSHNDVYLVVSLHRGVLLRATYHNDVYLVVSLNGGVLLRAVYHNDVYLVVSLHRGELLRAVCHNDVYLVVSLHRGVLLRAVYHNDVYLVVSLHIGWLLVAVYHNYLYLMVSFHRGGLLGAVRRLLLARRLLLPAPCQDPLPRRVRSLHVLHGGFLDHLLAAVLHNRPGHDRPRAALRQRLFRHGVRALRVEPVGAAAQGETQGKTIAFEDRLNGIDARCMCNC